jgi:hypothetical protein
MIIPRAWSLRRTWSTCCWRPSREVWISTRCEDTSSGVPVLSAHLIVDQAYLAQGHFGEVQDKRR